MNGKHSPARQLAEYLWPHVEAEVIEKLKQGLAVTLQQTYSEELIANVLTVLQNPSPQCREASVKFFKEMSAAVSVEDLLNGFFDLHDFQTEYC